MGADLKRILVVDVEATCWETREEQGSQPNEIIEIGACELIVKTGEIINKTSIAVAPKFTKISPFCTQLTGWTQEVIDEEGLSIEEAFDAFDSCFSPTAVTIWASFGEYDRHKLSAYGNAGVGRLYNIHENKNPFDRMRSHWNIKTLMAVRYKMSKELGLSRALNFVGETLEGRHHNGADDAYNIAKVLRKVLA